MKFLENEYIYPPVNNTILSDISNENLSQLLIVWRDTYAYEIDGLVIVDDKVYPRPEKNPDYAFAFKMVHSDQGAEAKIIDVIWTPSKDGYLKPRIRIEPVVLGGARIEYATGNPVSLFPIYNDAIKLVSNNKKDLSEGFQEYAKWRYFTGSRYR